MLAMLALDLGVFHRKAHVVPLRESLIWTVVWVVLALIFAAGIWHFAGSQKAREFFTGYLIEKSLSVDNRFVFALLFTYFAVPPQFQHKVLFWGILGALIMRAVMIALGAVLIAKFALEAFAQRIRDELGDALTKREGKVLREAARIR